jgi:hypothetical protein
LKNNVSLHDFGNVEIQFKNWIEEEFEGQLDHYVKFDDMKYYNF